MNPCPVSRLSLRAGRKTISSLALFLLFAASALAQLGPSNAVTVKLLDPIDSVRDAAGTRYHAAVAKDTAVGGVFLAKGAEATITLVAGSGGSRWTLNLVELTVNGKVAGVFGQNPAVVPTSAGDFFTMSKKTVTTRDRIAVAPGENIRFVLGPANGQTLPPPASSASSSPMPGGQNTTSAPAPVDVSAAYRSAPVAGPKPGADAYIGPYGSVLYGKYLHIEVRLDGCARHATSSSTCDFSIWDRREPQMIGMSIGAFGLVDSKGQVIPLDGPGAKCCDGRNRSVIIPGVVSHAHYTYTGLDPDVTSLARVSIKVYEAGTGGNDDFEFRNVPLGVPAANPQSLTPVSRLPQKLVAQDSGWQFSVVRCSPMTTPEKPDSLVVECYFKVENLKADRSIEFRGASFVDDQGRSHDDFWPFGDSHGNIGDASAYARTRTVPRQPGIYKDRLDGKLYNQPPVKYGSPRFVYAVFPGDEKSPGGYAGLPKEIRHIAHLDCNFSDQATPGALNRSFSVSFDDVALTPVPGGAAARTAPHK